MNSQSTNLTFSKDSTIFNSVNQSSEWALSESAAHHASLDSLVYRVDDVASMLSISQRAAYNLCNRTKDFRVLHIGGSIRVNKQSFDEWFAAAGE
jgi:hypothetical protein